MANIHKQVIWAVKNDNEAHPFHTWVLLIHFIYEPDMKC